MTVSALETDASLPDEIRADLSMVRRNVELEAKLIDDLLDLSRVSSGKLQLRMESVGIHSILKHVFEVCGPDLHAKRIDLTYQPRATVDGVTGDPARLQQVFWNLLKNAVKFTPQAQQHHGRDGKSHPCMPAVKVTDTGVGIEPDVLPRLFNAFEQGNPAVTRQFGGLGLGLAIAKAVVDLHGGNISVIVKAPVAARRLSWSWRRPLFH